LDEAIRRLRDRIDTLDAELLARMNERARCADEIGHLKGESAVYRPEREAQVLRRLTEINEGPLPAEAVRHLFTELISACRALERTLSVAYLGPRGTFSEEAVRRQFGDAAEGLPLASIPEVFRAVAAGEVNYGVVPVENSTEGGVGQTLDELAATPLRICAEVQLPIHHCLLAKSAAAGEASTVYAHAQALAQCDRWLARHLPAAARVALASNAEAARRAAAEPGSAAIASAAAAPIYGLELLAENIEDVPGNTTRFLVLGAQAVSASGRDRTSLVMAAANRPGGLLELLGPLARHGVSMSRLESRPSRLGKWDYLFFVDIEGHESDPAVASALAEVRDRAAFLKILGAYPVAVA
jgi:chorismate mutase/prephenate dehydratase